jgi:hypothetical protein
MVQTHECKLCNYKTHNKYNYLTHLKTKKHSANLEKNKLEKLKLKLKILEESQQHICSFCKKKYNRIDNLKRHLNMCKNKKNINIDNSITNNNTNINNNINNGNINNGNINNAININILSNEQTDKKKHKSKIDLLNEHYGYVIPLLEFAKNIDLPEEECKELLLHYSQDKYVQKDMYNKRYVHSLKAESYRQHLDKGLIEKYDNTSYPTFVLPICSKDNNCRTISIKGENGWFTTSNDKHFDELFQFVNNVIFTKKKDMVLMNTIETTKLIKQIKKESPFEEFMQNIKTLQSSTNNNDKQQNINITCNEASQIDNTSKNLSNNTTDFF